MTSNPRHHSKPGLLADESLLTKPTWSHASLDVLDNVYQLQCLSRMNAIYYGLRLSRVQTISFWMEVTIAATASGSGLASIVANSADFIGILGQAIWPLVAIVAALFAIVRPIYAPGRKIEAFTRQHQGYQANYFALKKLAFAIRQENTITSEHRRRYDTCFDRHVQLSTDGKSSEDEVAPNDRFRKEAEARTRAELPSDRFWWPSDAQSKPG
jgi:hypothetical protein